MWTMTSGRMAASSHASSELSTASFTPMMSDFTCESNPRICRFLSKNSETDISFCFFASSSAIELMTMTPQTIMK